MPFAPSARKLTIREQRLLALCGGMLACFVLMNAHVDVQTSRDLLDRAHSRLRKAKSETALLASTEYRELLSSQKLKLSTLRIVDSTAAISELRMREELSALAMRAGLRNVTFIDARESDSNFEISNSQKHFSVVLASLEADFDWLALTSLLGAISDFHRGYLIEGLEVRRDGNAQRMQVTVRILHQSRGEIR